MKKKKMLLIASIIIITVLLCGCNESSNDSKEIDFYSFDYSKVEYDFRAEYDKGTIMFWLDFAFPYQYFGQNTMEGCEIKELNYVLYGNGHYVGGQKLTKLRSGDNMLHYQGIGEFYSSFEVSTLNTSVIPYKRDWLVFIHPELKSAMENETIIKWTSSGEISFYTPEENLVTFEFENLSYYQSEFS